MDYGRWVFALKNEVEKAGFNVERILTGYGHIEMYLRKNGIGFIFDFNIVLDNSAPPLAHYNVEWHENSSHRESGVSNIDGNLYKEIISFINGFANRIRDFKSILPNTAGNERNDSMQFFAVLLRMLDLLGTPSANGGPDSLDALTTEILRDISRLVRQKINRRAP